MRLGALLLSAVVVASGASASLLPGSLLDPSGPGSADPAEAGAGALGEGVGHGHGHDHDPAHAHTRGNPSAPADGADAEAPATGGSPWAADESPWAGVPRRSFAWSPAEGEVPDADDPGLRRLKNLVARTDEGLAELAAKGFLEGRGTEQDPYVIEGVRVSRDLSVSDSSAFLVIRNSVVLGQLTLNWNGPNVHLHHTYVRDLRVNENVERFGDVTGGLIEHNVIGFVGQLRHYEGEFRENTVGPRSDGPLEPYLDDAGVPVNAGEEVLNFDGFHRAKMHHNTFHGEVDIKLHGHHHGSCLLCVSHDHADGEVLHAAEDPAVRQESLRHPVDHTDRWHLLDFHDNRIVVERGPALIYRDTPHAADDQTANSEETPTLELPHTHHTAVRIADNVLEGGGMVLRVFNAQDDRHRGGAHAQEGLLRVEGNQVLLTGSRGPGGLTGMRGGTGFDLHDATGLKLLLLGNEVRVEPGEDPLPPGLPRGVGGAPREERAGTGFLLRQWHGSLLEVAGNAVRGAEVGLRARSFDEATTWTLRDNTWDTAIEVDYDRSVAHAPASP